MQIIKYNKGNNKTQIISGAASTVPDNNSGGSGSVGSRGDSGDITELDSMTINGTLTIKASSYSEDAEDNPDAETVTEAGDLIVEGDVSCNSIYSKVYYINDLYGVKQDLMTNYLVPFDQSLTDHQQRITALETKVNSNINDINTMKTDIANLKSQYQSLLTRISTLENKVNNSMYDEIQMNNILQRLQNIEGQLGII